MFIVITVNLLAIRDGNTTNVSKNNYTNWYKLFNIYCYY